MLYPLSGCTSMLSPPLFPFFTACRCSSSSVTRMTSVLPRQGWEDGLSPLSRCSMGLPGWPEKKAGAGARQGLCVGWRGTGQDAGFVSEGP